MGRKFNRLVRKVEHEYENKGISHDTAIKWAKGTAANIYRIKLKNHSVNHKVYYP